MDENYHLGVSLLARLPIGMVSKFPLDYMHNVCFGVVRKLLTVWIGEPLTARLSNIVVRKISSRLESFKVCIPLEFNRKCRSLEELSRWKATELRTYLLYVGPIVLRTNIDLAIYEHFLLLHCAINILTSEKA